MYATRFKVRGNFSFPVDMLRYDACYPATQDAVNKMRWQADGETREVTLMQLHQRKNGAHVTEDRWASFGWEVFEILPAYKYD